MPAITFHHALRTLQITSLTALIALTTACGGGGNSDDVLGTSSNREANDAPPQTSEQPPVTNTPAVQLALGAGEGTGFQQGVIVTGLGNNTLAHGGQLEVSVNIVDSSDNSLYTAGNVTVSFSSDCASDGEATIDTSVITDTGIARAIYEATTCEGSETIRASISGNQATATFDIASIDASSLAFVSAEPSTLALKGMGSLAMPETSEIQFMVKDNEGNPIANKTIRYSLSTTVGGITLSTPSSVSNQEGVASVFLNAGNTQTTVSVQATVQANDGSNISVYSPAISIVGALPDQDSFTISAETFNPGGWDKITTTEIGINAGDQNNNLALNSTRVNFYTNGGAIAGSCILNDGKCAVTWTSQKPRPSDGLVHIIARSTGEESYDDANGNGLFDIGETILTPLDEAFLDDNRDGIFNDSDKLFDFDGSGDFTAKTDDLFLGASCSFEATQAGHCASLVEVRETLTLCMSTDDVIISDDRGGNFDVDFGDTVRITITDLKGLTPAVDTNIEVKGVDLKIIAGDKVTVPNECSENGFSFDVVVDEDGQPDTTGKLVIKVTQANGQIVSHVVTVRD